MHLSKADAKDLERRGILPGAVEVKINSHWPYKSKWEEEYASHLKTMWPDPEIQLWYERVTFVLVPPSATQKGVRYTPDFTVWDEGALLSVHEVKGWMRPGAKHKVKSLAQMIKPTAVYVVRKEKGAWVTERF